jgi:hypothetical protein
MGVAGRTAATHLDEVLNDLKLAARIRSLKTSIPSKIESGQVIDGFPVNCN